MLTVALTGGIACGKSVVADILRSHGCVVASADRDAHAVMAPGGTAFGPVVARFGPGILAGDGTIDRKRLGAIVFADPAARRDLDRIVHPLVIAHTRETAARLEREGAARIFVSEAALTFEAGFEGFFDKIVVVDCGGEEQVRRLMARDGLGEEEARRRVGAQMPAAEKRARADYVIDASGDLALTVEETERVYAQLMRDADLKDARARSK